MSRQRSIKTLPLLLGLLFVFTLSITPALAAPAGRPTAVFPGHPATNRINGLLFASGESDGQPVNTSNRFSVGTERVYSFFDFSGITPDEVISGTWYLGSRVLIVQRHTLNELFNGKPPDSGSMWLYTGINGGFSPGIYRLEIRVGDELERTGEFRVEPKAGQAVLANVVFTDKVNSPGANVRYPVNVLYSFPAGTKKVYAVFDSFEMSDQHTYAWTLSREGLQLGQQKDRAWDGKKEGAFAIPIDLTGQSGVFDLDLSLDGNWVAAESFVVGDTEDARAHIQQKDDFTDPASGWGTAHSGSNSVDYANGSYELSAADGDAPLYGTSGRSFSDGIAQIQFQFRNVPSDVNEKTGYDKYGYAGLVVRYQNSDNYYAFVVSPNGQYAIFHLVNGDLKWDRQWTQALQAIIPLGTDTRSLRVLAKGPQLRFYVDGRLVDLVTDAQWNKGQAGVIAGKLGAEPVTVDYQNWKQWSLPTILDQPSG